MSTSTFLLLRLLAVFLLFCLSKASGGTCLSYGHSCWGGHGKRSGTAHMIGPSSPKRTSEWYISKLLEPIPAEPKSPEAVFKSKNSDSEEMVENFRQSGYQPYPGSDAETDTSTREGGNSENDLQKNKWDSDGGDFGEEIMVLTPQVQRVPLSKFRLFPIMNQENVKQRSEY